MNKSDKINELAAALSIVQGKLRPAEENARNPFLKNQYADLGSVWSSCRDLLAEHGLSVAQFPTSDNGTIGLTTILSHTSGQWMEDTIHLPLGSEKGKSQAQVAGSIISYLRRYALASVLGIVTGEDDDGNAGADPRKRPAQKPRQPAQNGNSKAPGVFDDEMAKAIPYFKNGFHVKATRDKLGIPYPDSGNAAKNAREALEGYAKQNADAEAA